MKLALLLAVILFDKFSEAKEDSYRDAFSNTVLDQHLEWIILSDRVSALAWTRTFQTAGISFTKTTELDQHLQNYTYTEDEMMHVLIIRICQNSSAFFSSIEQISNSEEKLNSAKDWKPKYFVVWPAYLASKEEAEKTFHDKIFKKYSQSLKVESNIYVVLQIRELNTTETKLTLWESYSTNLNVSVFHQVPPMDWYAFTNKMSRRSNLHGSLIRVMSADDPYYEDTAKFKDLPPNELPEFESGTSVSMLDFMRDALNFTVQAVKGNLTSENLEGVVTGGVIEMSEDIADLSISQTPMTPEREKHIHFLQPTFLDGLYAYFIQPSAGIYRDIYFKSFALDVWITLLVIWMIMLFSMHGFGWIKKRFAENEDLDREILKESFLWALGATCQQGWHKQPSSFSMRLVFLVGYLKAVVCFVAFSASIVSTLSVKSVPVKTFKDLRDADFKLYVLEHSTALIYVNSLLNRQTSGSSYVVNDSVALSYLEKAQYSLITYPVTFKILTSNCSEYTSKYICETFTSVPLARGPIRSAMMVKRNSPYTEFFNYQIILMRERGIVFRFYIQYLRNTRPVCLDLSTGNTKSLEFLDVQSAFWILAVGYVLSMIIFGVEKSWVGFVSRNNRNY